MNVTKVMKSLRLDNKKTQKEVANYLGITRPAYVRYETNQREPGLETISKLAEFYKVPVQTFFMISDKIYKYENLFLAELGTLFDRKVYQIMNVTDYLHFNKAEKQEGFVYEKKNQISDDEIQELRDYHDKLMAQLVKLGDEVKKAVDRDIEYYRKK